MVLWRSGLQRFRSGFFGKWEVDFSVTRIKQQTLTYKVLSLTECPYWVTAASVLAWSWPNHKCHEFSWGVSQLCIRWSRCISVYKTRMITARGYNLYDHKIHRVMQKHANSVKEKILCAVIKPRDHVNIQLSRQRLFLKSVKTRATMPSGIVASKR